MWMIKKSEKIKRGERSKISKNIKKWENLSFLKEMDIIPSLL